MPRATIVVNPISGSGRRGGAVADCTRTLEDAGWAVDTVIGTDREHGSRAAEEAATDGADAVIAAGGDGTVRATAAGVLAGGGRPALGILPVGTANLLARDLGIPADGAAVARLLLGENRVALDVAEADGAPFLCCLGAGFDAYVVHRMDALRTGHIGFASYVRPVLHALRRYGFPSFRITPADGPSLDAVLALVLNTPTYGGFLRPAPDARPDDGLLDAVVIRHGSRRNLPRWLLAAVRGRLHLEPDVEIVRSTGFRLESEPPVPTQVDGDVGGATPVDILIRPAALQVACPPEPPR